MKKIIVLLSFFCLLSCSESVETNPKETVTDDQTVFNAHGCNACHTIGEGKLIGPDLKGVASRRDTEWLKSWITNSSELIASGDKDAVALFKEFNNSPMAAYSLSQAEMNSLLDYLK